MLIGVENYMVDLSLTFKSKKIVLDPLQELKPVPAKAKISPNDLKKNGHVGPFFGPWPLTNPTLQIKNP